MGLPWNQLAFLLSVVAAWSLVIIGTMQFILTRSFKQYDDKLLAQESALKELESGVEGRFTAHLDCGRKLEKCLLEMRADLPLNYVRKEDFIRHEVVINAKLDRLGDQIAYIGEKLK
jgi:hypothetical protein